MKVKLQDVLKGKVVIVGVGNILRGDDAMGPVLVERLKGHVRAVCLDAGTAPESYAGKMIKETPDTILIVDALHHGGRGGEYVVLTKEDIEKSGFTTHDLSPKMLIEYLESQTQADIYLLGVQPENLSIGGGMSEAVKQTIDRLEKELKELIHA